MKWVGMIAALLLLGGCEHMYGAGDIRLSDADAIQVAKREAARRHLSIDGLQPAVTRADTGVAVSFATPECRRSACIDGGLPYFFIPAGARRVSYVRTTY